MKHATVTVEVGGLFQVLDATLVARQLQKLPGGAAVALALLFAQRPPPARPLGP